MPRHALVQRHAPLARAAKGTVERSLSQVEIRPDKIGYEVKRGDPDALSQMKAVLGVDREVALAEAEGVKNASGKTVSAVSADEQPGVQAPATVTPDLPPVKGKPPTPARDYDYKRLGTASILAALNLQTGQVSARLERRNRSREVIALL